jgi:hypothetical protein
LRERITFGNLNLSIDRTRCGKLFSAGRRSQRKFIRTINFLKEGFIHNI